MVDRTQQPGILIGQVFLERAHFSHREDALTLPHDTPIGRPVLTVNFQGGVSPDGKAGFVRISVQTKPEERPLYILDVAMAAMVEVEEGKANLSLHDYVRGPGPAMLYPFIREVVANLTWRGRFGPLWLTPMNVGTLVAGRASDLTQPIIGGQPEFRLAKPAPKAKKRRPRRRRAG